MRPATPKQVKYARILACKLGAGEFWLEEFVGCPQGGDIGMHLDISEAKRIISSLKRGDIPA